MHSIAKGKTLVIVESPAKAKTIEKYLGDAFIVRASIGHIRDLPKSNKKAIDIEGGFVPRYVIVPGKDKVIQELKELAHSADDVLLATDPDREGEAIAWHIANALGLNNPKRIVFHEITASAIKEAIAHPRPIDERLRSAQEARRVLDRLVGYDLSGIIWKKVRYGLSAGRVQSAALRIIMEREREIRAFVPVTFWRISATVETPKKELLTLFFSEEPKDHARVEHIVREAQAHPWMVTDLKETEAARAPRPPFTTSTLQQAASTRLGMSPANTMRIAQKLYEAGLITYMRTDSTHLAAEAQREILSVIAKEFGPEHAEARVYKTKSKNAQEAHEAIRPTNAARKIAGTTAEMQRLYRLIWQRTVASQMKDARSVRTKITANITDTSSPIPDFYAHGSRLIFPGWLLADPDATGEEVMLPAVSTGDALTLNSITSEEKQTEAPPRYTEAGLVKELEKRDIGRPSTYASIIKTIIDRGYVIKEGKSLVPTETGDVVSSFLEQHFGSYISDNFTAEMENELDDIATGKRDYVNTLSAFYEPFTKAVQSKEHVEKVTTLGVADPSITCPKCGGGMVYKLARHGKFLSCAQFPSCDGSRMADGSIIEPPKSIGEKCPKCAEGELVERDGKYGRFIACSNFPKCKYIKNDPETAKLNSTGVKCNLCKEGEMIARRGRFGIFYGCSNYPKCKNATKTKPTGNSCPLCSSLMMEGTKTIPERCAQKECPNHNPHKLKR